MKAFEVDFKCIIVEDGKRCQNGFIMPYEIVKRRGYNGSKYICKKHLERGYCWMNSFLEDPTMEILDETKIDLPKRANELYLKKDSINPAVQLLKHYGTVQVFYAKDALGREYVEDVLLLPTEEAVDPKAPILKRKNKTVGSVGGFAVPPAPKEE
jgi:hypothetical protein